jgi:1,2-diacylglycerol 3-alpha-glucosyltransferase
MAFTTTICMISDDFLPAATGVGVHLKLIGPELVRRGHRVSVITTRRTGEPALEEWEGVAVHRVPTLKVYGFHQALPSRATIHRIFEQEKPDVVHHHYVGLMMRRVCAVAERMHLPQVSTYHFSAEVLTQPLPMRPFRGVIRRQIVAYNNRFDMVIAPSRNLGDRLAVEGIHTPVRHVTNPVAFEASDSVVPAERTPGCTILYAGRLGPEKNLPYLLRAFAGLLRRVPGAVVWIAGRGPERESLDRLCAELGIGSRVRFLGFLDHPTLARCYAACDVFVLPSLEEAQPLVAMEAMWFGRPVIVTRAIVAATEMVDQGVNGYIVDPETPRDLVDRLVTLATDASLRTGMGEASRQRAQAYRPELAVSALEQAYHDVIAQYHRG